MKLDFRKYKGTWALHMEPVVLCLLEAAAEPEPEPEPEAPGTPDFVRHKRPAPQGQGLAKKPRM